MYPPVQLLYANKIRKKEKKIYFFKKKEKSFCSFNWFHHQLFFILYLTIPILTSLFWLFLCQFQYTFKCFFSKSSWGSILKNLPFFSIVLLYFHHFTFKEYSFFLDIFLLTAPDYLVLLYQFSTQIRPS
jgi:hypothetical protein